MNKADLIKLLDETDLPPEALETIASIVEKHRGGTHDAALETIEEAPLNNAKLIELWEACYGEDRLKNKIRAGLSVAEFKNKMEEFGFSKLFSNVQGDDNVVFLTDKSGITWVLPLNHQMPAYLPSRMFDNDAIEHRFDSMKKLVAPCRGKFEEGNFQVETRGKVI